MRDDNTHGSNKAIFLQYSGSRIEVLVSSHPRTPGTTATAGTMDSKVHPCPCGPLYAVPVVAVVPDVLG